MIEYWGFTIIKSFGGVVRPPVSVSEEKWLINQNIFLKTKEWRLSEIKNGNTLCWREINKTCSRVGMNRKVMLYQARFVMKIFPVVSPPRILMPIIYCWKYSKWKTTNHNFNSWRCCVLYRVLLSHKNISAYDFNQDFITNPWQYLPCLNQNLILTYLTI